MKLIFFYLFIVACNAIIVKEPKNNVRVVSKGCQTKPESKIPEANQYDVVELIDEFDFCQSNCKKEPLQYAEIVEDENSSDGSYDANDGSVNNYSSYDGSEFTYNGSDNESDDGSYNGNDSSGILTATDDGGNSVTSISNVNIINNESDNDNYGTISDDDGDTNINENIDITGDDNSQNIDESNSSGNDNNNSLNSNNGDNTSSNNNNSGSNDPNNNSNDDSDNNSSDNSSNDGSDNNTSDGTSDSSDNGSNGNDDGFEFTGKVRAKGRVTIQAHFNGGCDTGTDCSIAYKRNDNDCNQGNQGNACSSKKYRYKNTYSPYLLLPPASIPQFFNQILNTNCGTVASGSVRDCGANGNGAIGYPCNSGCTSGQGNNLYGYNCMGSTGSESMGYPSLGYDCSNNGLYSYPLYPGANDNVGSYGSNSNGANTVLYSNNKCYNSGNLPKMNAQGLVTITGSF